MVHVVYVHQELPHLLAQHLQVDVYRNLLVNSVLGVLGVVYKELVPTFFNIKRGMLQSLREGFPIMHVRYQH